MTEMELRRAIKAVTGRPVRVHRPKMSATWGDYEQKHGWSVFSGPVGYIDLGHGSRREALRRFYHNLLNDLGTPGQLRLFG